MGAGQALVLPGMAWYDMAQHVMAWHGLSCSWGWAHWGHTGPRVLLQFPALPGEHEEEAG